jgi:hypothetical protein
MARPRRELAKTHVSQFPAERLLGDLEAKLLEQPPREIDQPPANDAMMVWTASPQRRHSAKAWSQERHKEGDSP